MAGPPTLANMALRHVILTLLHQGPRTGYEIVKDFDDVVGYFWSASHQQVYRDLAQLTEGGLVRFTEVMQERRPDKKVYELTAAGRKALLDWVDAPITTPPIRDELLVKLLAGELMGSDGLERLVGDQRRVREKKLRNYRTIEKQHFTEVPIEQMPVVHRLAYMTLRRGILGEEAWLAWADELEAVIASLG